MNDEYLDDINQQEKKKMPKVLKVFLILFIIIAILVGAFFACFYVNDKTEVDKDPELKISEYYNDALSKSVDDTKEKKAMSFNVKQIVVNSLLHQIVQSADQDVKKYLRNIYVLYEDGDEIKIHINLKFGFFASRVTMRTIAELYDVEGEEDGGLRIALKEVIVGRIPGFANLVTFFGKKLNLEKIVVSMLEKQNLHFTLDLDKREIDYPYENIREDLGKIIEKNTEEGEGSTKLEIFQDLLTQFLSDDFTEYEIVKNDSLNLDLNCEYFSEGVDETKKKTYDLTGLKEFVSVLYKKNEKIKAKNILQILTYYYINGYSRLPSHYQTYVGSLDFSDYTQIPDYTQYKGIEDLYSGTDVDTALQEQLSNTVQVGQRIANGTPIVDLTADNISSTIRNKSKIMGYTSVLERVEEGNLIYNYMLVNDFYCSLKEETTTFYISISLNGYDLNVMLNTKAKHSEENPYVLDFVVEDIYLGKYKIKSATISDTINTLVNNTIDETLSIKIRNEENLIVSIDLTSTFEPYKTAIEATNKSLVFDVGSTVDHLTFSCK